jgi:hypothetical protein
VILKRDRDGTGDFYEAILALMVVTAGILILTVSLTFSFVPRDNDQSGIECQKAMDLLLNNQSVMVDIREIDGPSLSHLNLSNIISSKDFGIKVMLIYPDGSISVLMSSGNQIGNQRFSRSEPVNVYFSNADVRSALLTIWVWK